MCSIAIGHHDERSTVGHSASIARRHRAIRSERWAQLAQAFQRHVRPGKLVKAHQPPSAAVGNFDGGNLPRQKARINGLLGALLAHEGPFVHRLALVAVNAGDALRGLSHVLFGEGVTVSVFQQVLKVLVSPLVAPAACAEYKGRSAVVFGPTGKRN